VDEQRPWYESFFGPDYLEVYDYQFSAERDELETRFAIQALDLKPGEEVLDLCSGQGRHAVLLAKHGCRVSALDLSEPYLKLAQAAARTAGVQVETVLADMREIPFSDRFDGIVNMFSSFGYLESEAEDAKALDAIRRALKPGGRVLMDLLNRDWVIANYETEDSHTGADGTAYLEHRRFDLETSRNHVWFTVVTPDGQTREVDGHHIRLYTLREMRAALEAAGLAYDGVYGGFQGEEYSIGTRRMILVARRTG
jgi:SAM-dependent methyltransferase